MRRWHWLGVAVGAVVLLGLLVFGERLIYLVGAARFQAELLWGRVPNEQVELEPERMERLRQVPEIKAFGKQIGLAAIGNYDTINPTWDRTIWNVSGADPVRFENRRWWFPIVGSVPYLGFFDEAKADAEVAELEADGLDVYKRTAGAYSTLGWFEDPLTPNMLKWSEHHLANTILHELAHATVWIPGSVQFNESFANFVGDEASDRYMRAKYGDDSEQVRAMQARLADATRWRQMLHAVYLELDAVYEDPALDREQKLARKAAVFADLPRRVELGGFAEPDRYLKAAREGTWNNARMMQYRTYNRSRSWFQALYEQEDRDLLRFMHAVERVTAGADDPYRALALAVGADPDRDH